VTADGGIVWYPDTVAAAKSDERRGETAAAAVWRGTSEAYVVHGTIRRSYKCLLAD